MNTKKLIFHCISALIVVVFFLLFCVDSTNLQPLKKRVKRKVVFTKSSKFFFRLNGKENVINYTTTLAHGWGFRINYELPSSLNQRLRFFKRDVHSDIEKIQHPLVADLANCVMMRICSVLSLPLMRDQKCGMFCGVAKIITESQGIEADFFKRFSENCRLYQERCPERFDNSSIFGYG